ncbi:MAG: acetyl/propionyl/methylcrotonyl-CoA carboxylase subunit alpha [Syntrophales bacterium]
MLPRKRIRKILIANRGEVALRIIRAIRELGREAVVAYERPDSDAYYIRFAEEAIMIGDGPVKDYLDIEKMIWAARKTGADAIHPGYGFLSENADFAAACERAGITFIGPPSRVIRNLGNKVIAREIMRRVGIPVIPGTYTLSPGERGIGEAVAFGGKTGYPIMVKSSGGSGGRGVTKVLNETDLVKQIVKRRSRARKYPREESIYLEKCIESSRHIEIQILADSFGNIIHLGSRDCSIQRRHQKLLELAPAALPPEVLNAMYAAAIRAAREVDYINAGTVEFLLDPRTMEFWFMAMNPRLQVEHTVTEELVNVDIVRQQIMIAEGNRLEIPQEYVNPVGSAIQVRINAEDPLLNFRPDGGKTVEVYLPPGGPGIRLDGILYQGYRIPTEYDSLLVKLTVRGFNWEQALSRLERALDVFLIVGPKTTIPFYRAICDDPDFIAGRIDTGYIYKHPGIFNYPDPGKEIANLETFLMDMYTAEFFPYSWL